MAISNSTTLASLLPEIVAEAIFTANERSLMRALVRNFTIPAGSGNSIKVPIYPTQAAASANEATAFAGNVVNTGAVAISVGDVGMSTTVSDQAMIGSASNVIADIGGQFGRGIAAKIDEDLCALFANFATTVGAAGTLTGAMIFEAIAKLRTANAPASDMAVVIHPEVAYDLKAGLTNTFVNPNNGISTQVMQDSYVGNLGGVNVYESTAMGITAGGVSVGAVFHKDALGLAMMKDITVESQRESTLRADTLTAHAVYGVSELIDLYGCNLNNTSTI